MSKPTKPAGSVSDFFQAAECLKALSHPVRLRMIQLLLHGEFTVGELAADCEVAENVASDHLRLLQRCGLLTANRMGRYVHYQVTEPHLSKFMDCIESRFIANSSNSKRKSQTSRM